MFELKNPNPIDDVVLPLFREFFDYPLYLTPPTRKRLLSFIEKLSLSQEELKLFYRYVFQHYKEKGYKVKAGHLCSSKILSFLELVRDSFYHKPYYHPLFKKRLPTLTPPYDEKLFRYLKFARQIYSAPKIIYVPRAGLVLEIGYIYYKQAVGETNHFKDEYEEYKEIFKFFLEYAKNYRHRDHSRRWRKKPFWKCLIHQEVFPTFLGSLYYEEALYLVENAEYIRGSRLDRLELKALKGKLERFQEKYSEYLWLLPKPRAKVIQIINKFLSR